MRLLAFFASIFTTDRQDHDIQLLDASSCHAIWRHFGATFNASAGEGSKHTSQTMRFRHHSSSRSLCQILALHCRYGDVALVPVVDVYRSLAAKLLAFFGAILERSVEFDFLYKTDDDTVANLEAIRDHVPTTRQNVWWSSFRENWPVERYGKWAEASYR